MSGSGSSPLRVHVRFNHVTSVICRLFSNRLFRQDYWIYMINPLMLVRSQVFSEDAALSNSWIDLKEPDAVRTIDQLMSGFKFDMTGQPVRTLRLGENPVNCSCLEPCSFALRVACSSVGLQLSKIGKRLPFTTRVEVPDEIIVRIFACVIDHRSRRPLLVQLKSQHQWRILFNVCVRKN